MPFTAKTTHEGATLDVTLDDEAVKAMLEAGGYQFLKKGDVPTGFVTQETLNATVRERLNRQKEEFKSSAEKAKDVLLAHSIPMNDDGTIAFPKKEDIDEAAITDRLKRAILKEQVEPLQRELDVSRSKVSRILDKFKREAILEAARAAKVDEFYLTAHKEDEDPPIVQKFGSSLVYHEDTGDFVVVEGRNEDGSPRYAHSTKEGKAYKDKHDFFGDVKADKRYEGIFNKTNVGTYSPGNTNGVQTGQTKASFKSLEEKSAYVAQHGLDAYEALPDGSPAG